VIADPLGDAVRRMAEGGLIAYPTETVWGLGADARSDAAVARLRAWKGRSEDSPISILVEDFVALAVLDFELGPLAKRLIGTFWPGPLTLVLPCRARFARGVARADGAVGVRCSAHPLAAALARRCAREGVGPVTATSLNRTGRAPARTRAEAAASCDDGDGPRLLDVQGAEAGGETETTVIDLAGDHAQVLRWGALTDHVVSPVLRESGHS
jgi:L-threonylcarbamoyladenylate synthase